MKKAISTLGALAIVMALVLGACKKTPPPLSERIAKSWTAESVREGSSVVFTRGGANNSQPGYSNFRLTFVGGGNVTYNEFDNRTFTGQWEVVGDNRLVLRNLTPQPTGTNGTIEFTINSFDDSRMVLTRTTASVKTGGTINEYTLSNP